MPMEKAALLTLVSKTKPTIESLDLCGRTVDNSGMLTRIPPPSVLIPRILIVVGLFLCSNVLRVRSHAGTTDKVQLPEISLNLGR